MIRKRELREAKECAEEYNRLWHEEMGRSDGFRHQIRALTEELAGVKRELAELKVENEAQRAYIAALMGEKSKRDAAE